MPYWRLDSPTDAMPSDQGGRRHQLRSIFPAEIIGDKHFTPLNDLG
jgi:hypothetical protein